MRKSEPLSTATERLYRAFSKYQPSPKLLSRLPAKVLRELNTDDFTSAGITDLFQLCTTDLKHLLPRIFELLIHDQWLARPEIVLSSLGKTEWRRWQKNEQNAVEIFLFAGWGYLVSEPVCVERIDQWLCASMQVLDAAEIFINMLTYGWWIQPLPKSAHFARLILLDKEPLSQGRLSNPYWSGREEQMHEAAFWLTSNFSIGDLDEVIDEHPHEPVTDELRSAAYALEEILSIEHKERTKPPLQEPENFIRTRLVCIGETLQNVEVTQAITHLYEVFAFYQRSRAAQAIVGTKPLDELTEDDLYEPTKDIILTWGTPQDLKHLLPRVLELTLEPGWWLRPEGIFFKMILADYYMWPKVERAAVERFVDAVWSVLLGEPDYPVSAEEWLCGASNVKSKLRELTITWLRLYKRGSTPAIIHWARFVTAICDPEAGRIRLQNPFWSCRHRDVINTGYGILSADHIVSYMRARGNHSLLPNELSEALKCMKPLWVKRGHRRSGASDIAFFNPQQALNLACGIKEPWYRCQELAGVAQNTFDEDNRDTALRGSFAAGTDTAEPNRILKVSSWPIGVLIELGLLNWARKEVARLIDVIRAEPHPYRRIDALNWLLKSSFNASPELYSEVLAEIGRAAEEAHGWRVAYLLMIGSETADDFDHAGAVHIALMIRNLRTRRRALRGIGEAELAEQQYA